MSFAGVGGRVRKKHDLIYTHWLSWVPVLLGPSHSSKIELRAEAREPSFPASIWSQDSPLGVLNWEPNKT